MHKTIVLLSASALLSGCFGGHEEYNESLKDHSTYHCQNQSFDTNSVRDKAEVESVYCDIQDFPAGDLSGLSQFPNLKTLSLDGRQTMDQLNVVYHSSWTPKLEWLNLKNINFETIYLSQLEQINRLSLNNVNMLSLDMSGLSSLQHFQLAKSNLTTLDLSYNTELETLVLDETQITHFNFSNNTKLTELTLALNNKAASSIELTNQPALKSLSILSQELETLYINLPKLESAHLSNNKLTAIDFSGSPELSAVQLADNLITNLNVDTNLKLSRLVLTGNPLTEETKSYLETLTWIEELEY
ncbi:MAG: hypothetical protein CMK64_07980 [Pseudoalteromonas sp.]|nr:hypothetical protein [Pseudoalteromonas sp.]|tara:strand:- start:2022 stop:2924 length:903 start_codon:yes stop_codon:yes gene_type:complete